MQSVIHSQLYTQCLCGLEPYWCLKHINEHTCTFLQKLYLLKYINCLARCPTYKYLIMIRIVMINN